MMQGNISGRKRESHLLLYCWLATRLWWDMFNWFGMFWGDAKDCEAPVVLPESWKKQEKEQRMECCSSSFDVDHMEREI